MTRQTVPRGAYGLVFPGVAPGALVEVRETWPAVEVVRRLAAAEPRPRAVAPDRVELPLVGGGRVELEREARRAVFTTPAPLGDDELVHPYLAPVGAWFGGWLGREAFHAGAFAVDGHVWGILGAKEAGKSTLLASLAEDGVAIVTDDILVIERERALAGPRCIDLRRDAPVRSSTRPVREGERGRVTLPPVAPDLPLAGWISLAWAATVDLRRLSPGERLTVLGRRHASRVSGRGAALLGLAALPAWELRRPRGLEALPALRDRLLELAAG